MAATLDTIMCLLFGVFLLLLGWWGRRHLVDLVPSSLPDDEQDHRAQVLWRGTWAAQVVGASFLVVALLVWTR
ncbi:hypothetical protein [Aeromicrobium sp. CTD01-1L150]|uniref:hypothetical protein n=1 Tax=Aeromicrobium sp. CTD01-1L150 TaxID=3341830 RepID=UPI0035C13DD4